MKKYLYRKISFIGFIMVLGLAGCTPILNNYSEKAQHFPATREATGHRVFIYDPKFHAWAAYDEEGNRVNGGRASGGKLYCPDIGRPCKTTAGTYRIFRKGDSSCQSSRYPISTKGGAPMPYCMYFHSEGFAIHGTASVANYYNSHGCIGVSVFDAKWLHDFLPLGSTVIVLPYPDEVLLQDASE